MQPTAPIPEQAHRFAASCHGRLIVSCQALPHEPLFGSDIMAAMALAAQEGGAAAIRANTPEDIAAIRAAVSLPIIGLYKVDLPEFDVYITPLLEHAQAVSHAGADVIAIDATNRPRPQGSLSAYIQSIHAATHRPVLADIASLDDARNAVDAGADFLSTTMSGYTSYSPQQEDPDFDLVAAVVSISPVPVFAEGRIADPAQAARMMELGAWACIVGGAITRPKQIAERFARAVLRQNTP